MATKKWLTGCGMGCLLMVVLTIVGGSLMFRNIKNTVGEFDGVGDMQTQLVEMYGGVSDFTPTADGTIPPERIEIYLRVQELIKPTGDEFSHTLHDLRALENGEGFSLARMINAAKGLGNLGSSVGRFLKVRNESLLAEGMGLGEYIYMTGTVYHAWLGEELDYTLDGQIEEGSSERRRDMVRGLFMGFLKRQQALARETGDPAGLAVAIDGELAELAIDAGRIPWQDGLPPTLLESLTPYRERLEAVATGGGALLAVGTEKDGPGFHFDIE
jgi:hypothetical protein